MYRCNLSRLLTLVLLSLPALAYGQTSDRLQPGIIWFGVLQDGLAQAQITQRPILLLSAAPQCAGVPGMW
ncbi:MAG: hypothetical protein MK106_14765 [Mariniblastus sp.]|nr:hypothetical protein [Mariniblastus sp.]